MNTHPMFSANMSDAINKFIVNSRQALDELNQALLSYEEDTSDLNDIDNLFKCVHALNGEASYIGHEQLVEFSEEFKNVLSLFRKGIETPSKDQLNVLFRAADLMNKLVEQVENREIVPIDVSDLVSELHTLTTVLTATPQEAPEETKKESTEPEKSFEPSPFMLEEANKQLVDPDMSIVVDACLLEAQDLFEGLEDDLNELGSSSSNRAALSKGIIKGLKSLRSSAGFLSLEQITTQSKYLQLLLKAIGEGTIEWIDEFHDLLHSGFSQLHALLLQVKEGKLVAVDYNNLVSALDKAAKGSFNIELLEGIPMLECGLTMETAAQTANAEVVEETDEPEPTEAQETSFYVGPDHPLYSDGMQEIVESFVVETGELFDDLDNKLLELEHNYKDEALVNDIFRAVHTIKGSAGFLGLDQLNQLAHHFEDVLNQLRRGGLAFHSDMLDIMFEAFDLMKVLQQQVIDMKLEVIDTQNIVKQLKLISEGKFEGVSSS
ncbi:MAG: Hpt domain-containing protein, partial [Rhodothermaceae bacterium]|nr:Hpt domain-containing protein [Rhodothermaceae bacterium]